VYKFGAVYKPSGAGGGDLGIAFVRSADELTELASLIQKANFEIVHLQMGVDGVQIQKS
jgi:mevalonate kinase